MFHISEYFDEYRDQYLENLGKISATQDWQAWILFFLEAIAVQAKRNSAKASQVLNLYHAMRARFPGLTKSPHASQVLDTLFVTPIFRTPDFMRLSGMEAKSAHRIIARLKSEKILATVQKHSGRTAEVLVFDELYQLIR